ncbi:MAG TPA: hypothetical protein VLG92_00705 [Candidatus Saccharimonadia bacterium]|nr:hypothetical protein [Candidatus Saccharimonadia bacterium]
MSAAVMALIVSVGLSGWVFAKLHSRTGYGNSRAALTGAGVTFALTFIVVFTLVHQFLH